VIYCLFHNGEYQISETNVNKLRNIILQKDYFIELREEIEKIVELKTLFYGLLQVEPRDRISFVELRDFMNKLLDKFKDSEDEIRYGIFNKRKGNAPDIRKLTLKKSNSMRDSGKNFNAVKFDHTPLPPAHNHNSMAKDKHMIGHIRELHGEKFMNQSRSLLKLFRKKDIEDELNNTKKYP